MWRHCVPYFSPNFSEHCVFSSGIQRQAFWFRANAKKWKYIICFHFDFVSFHTQEMNCYLINYNSFTEGESNPNPSRSSYTLMTLHQDGCKYNYILHNKLNIQYIISLEIKSAFYLVLWCISSFYEMDREDII